jgi:hypothetical protein
MKTAPLWSCAYCKAPEPRMFMVHNHIWLSTGFRPRDVVCQPCLEKRIGRKLTLEDYTICPLNFDQVPGFGTDDNYRKLYAADGLDYDKTKAEYFERCERLGIENRWYKGYRLDYV